MEISNSIREAFEGILGKDLAERTLEAMQHDPSVSVRFNPSKPLEEYPEGTPVPWSSHALMLPSRPSFTMDPLFHAGCYYVQDSSAMFVGHIFRECIRHMLPGLRVLDLCAAPGGKSTDIAASLRELCGEDFLLVSNEVMKQRASVLSDNIALWGDPNVAVTSQDPKVFGNLEGFFDIIVADVPCSGEGMFRKDEGAVEQWSPENVELCAQRQRRIVADVWPSLREGGILIYSTCTFEPAENDLNLDWVCRELGAEQIYAGGLAAPFEGIIKTDCGFLLLPGSVPGEGQWVGAVRKTSPQRTCTISNDSALRSLRPMRFGLPQPELKGKDLIPSADMALCFDRSITQNWPRAELDLQTALHFLHRDTIVLPDAPRGFVMVCYQGQPLGFVKNLGTRCNNLHPMGRRILKRL